MDCVGCGEDHQPLPGSICREQHSFLRHSQPDTFPEDSLVYGHPFQETVKVYTMIYLERIIEAN